MSIADELAGEITRVKLLRQEYADMARDLRDVQKRDGPGASELSAVMIDIYAADVALENARVAGDELQQTVALAALKAITE